MSRSNHFQFDCRIFLNHSKCSISDSVLTVKCKMFPINWIAVVYLLAISTFNVADSITVTINKHITATEETNGTYLECHYSRENVDFFTQVFVQTLNGTKFENMISFVVNKNAYINHKWEFLKDRITFNNITNDANGTRIHFMKLLCVDNRSYRCHVKYVPQDSSSDPGYANSDISNISVTVGRPSHKPTIRLVRYDYTDYTPNGNATSRASEFPSLNKDTDCYILVDSEDVECKNIAVSCIGEVGDPPQNLRVKMIQSDGVNNSLDELFNHTSDERENCSFYQNSSFATNLTRNHDKAVFRCAVSSLIDELYSETDELDIRYAVQTPTVVKESSYFPYPPLYLSCHANGNPEVNFTWYRYLNSSEGRKLNFFNSNQNITLHSEDDNGEYMCIVSNNIGHITYTENVTETVNLTDAVQKPDIYIDPSNYTYPPINLSCHANENPGVNYTWSRYLNPSLEDTIKFLSNNQNITLNSTTDNGVYRCEVSTTIGRITYKKNDSVTIKFKASTDHDRPKATDKNAGNKNKIYYVIVCIAATAVIIIFIVVIIYLKKNRRKQKFASDEEPDGGSQIMGADNYNTGLSDSIKRKRNSTEENKFSNSKENQRLNLKYLEQPEIDDINKITQGGHQGDEYAMVNKPKKGSSNRNLGHVDYPTEYAQVNKVKKGTSYEIPMDDNPYASGQGIYDHAHDRRHEQPKDVEPYDTTSNISRRFEKVGAVADNFGKPIKQKQVAKIRPSGRSGYENAGMESDDILKTKDEPNTAL